jgi:antitoxin ParD1/3/4
MNVSLGDYLDAYIEGQVESGPFNNASEVVRDALRLHEQHQLKLKALRDSVNRGLAQIEAGEVSQPSPDEIIAQARTGG